MGLHLSGHGSMQGRYSMPTSAFATTLTYLLNHRRLARAKLNGMVKDPKESARLFEFLQLPEIHFVQVPW